MNDKKTITITIEEYNSLLEKQKQVDDLKERLNIIHKTAQKVEQAVKDTAKEILDKAIIIDKNTGGNGFICIEALKELCKSKGVEVE